MGRKSKRDKGKGADGVSTQAAEEQAIPPVKSAWGDPDAAPAANGVRMRRQSVDKSYDDDIVTVFLKRAGSSGFGFNLIGPEEDAQECHGVFITSVVRGSVADMCGQLQPGQQIMSVNGEDTQLLTKLDVFQLVKLCEDSITMELQEDLDGYARYDKGNEKRRQSMQAFFDTRVDLASNSYSGKYLGARVVEGRDAEAVQKAYKVIKKKPQTHIRGRVALRLDGPHLTVFKKELSVLQHVLLDVVHCQSSGPVLAVVCKQLVEGANANVCHMYLLNNKRRAQMAATDIRLVCDEGMKTVNRTVRKPKPSTRRPRSMHSGRARSETLRLRAQSQSMVSTVPSSRVDAAGPLQAPDAAMGLASCKWFFADMSQEEAVRTLESAAPESGFVVVRTARPDAYILLVKETVMVASHLITSSEGKYALAGTPQAFGSVQELIAFFQAHPYGTDHEGCRRTLAGVEGDAGAAAAPPATLQGGQRASFKIPDPPPEESSSFTTPKEDALQISVEEADEEQPHTVCMARPAQGGGYGMTFVGPSKDADRGHGVYVTGAKPGTPAAGAEGLMRGQQILAINGADARQLTKYEAMELIKGSDTLELSVVQRLEGFAKYDGAVLLRATAGPAMEGEEEVVVVTVTRPAGGGFGLSFVGPTDEVATAERQGVYVTNSRPDSVCGKAGLFRRGQRILSINGEDARKMSKFEVASVMKREKTIVLELQVDFIGFACYDDGKTFRRVSLRRKSSLARRASMRSSTAAVVEEGAPEAVDARPEREPSPELEAPPSYEVASAPPPAPSTIPEAAEEEVEESETFDIGNLDGVAEDEAAGGEVDEAAAAAEREWMERNQREAAELAAKEEARHQKAKEEEAAAIRAARSQVEEAAREEARRAKQEAERQAEIEEARRRADEEARQAELLERERRRESEAQQQQQQQQQQEAEAREAREAAELAALKAKQDAERAARRAEAEAAARAKEIAQAEAEAEAEAKAKAEAEAKAKAEAEAKAKAEAEAKAKAEAEAEAATVSEDAGGAAFRSRGKSFTAKGKALPQLAKVDHTKFASERERLEAEADVGETQSRLEEISFDFSW